MAPETGAFACGIPASVGCADISRIGRESGGRGHAVVPELAEGRFSGLLWRKLRQ